MKSNQIVRALVMAASMASMSAPRAAEIVLEPSAVQKLVRQALYKDRGRLMLMRGVCEAYLSDPVVSLAGGRVQIASRLAGRVGANAGGSCVGVTLAGSVRISGVPVAAGGVVHLEDIRVDVGDPNVRNLMDELGLSSLAPTAIELDVKGAVQTMLTQSAGDIQATVDAFSFQQVAITDNRLAMTFEFRLSGR